MNKSLLGVMIGNIVNLINATGISQRGFDGLEGC